MQKHVRTIFLSAVLTLGTMGAGLAADLPVRAPPPLAPVAAPPPFTWTGWYVGIQGGYGWADYDRSTVLGFSNSYDGDGWLFGGHVGYNWQFNQFVVGIEADAHWADITGDDGGVGGTLDRTKTDFLASVRARFGFAFDSVLLFVTAGGAWGSWIHTNPAGIMVENEVDRMGWTVGAGFQWAFMPNWSAGLEYRYYDFDSYSLNPVGLVPFKVHPTINTVTGRISYQF